MITLHDLDTAIAKCQGEDNPTAQTCIKLAAYYTIRDSMFGNPEKEPEPGYSFSAVGQVEEEVINYDGDSEFLQRINGRNPAEIWPIIDELMVALQVVNPRLYAAALRKLD